jgi:superfamily I DNA/RNA helicase
MEPLKTQTLNEVSHALRAIEDARDDISLPEQQKFYLETVAVQLRNIERSIIRTKELELIATLTKDSRLLKEMAKDLKTTAERLKKVSEGVEKVSKLVELLIKAVAGGISAGLL